MAEMVRRSACRGSKSVDASTISSPTRQPAAFKTSIEVLPALAVLDSLVQVLVRSPCRFSVPPEIMIPRSPMPAMTSSPVTLLVRVMVALRVWGLASLPMASSPCSMIHSVVSSRSVSLAKVSLPSIDNPPSAGGLTSRITSLSLPIVTLSPAIGTLRFGQVLGSDQFVGAACAIAHTPSRSAGTTDTRRNERLLLVMTSTPNREDDPVLRGRAYRDCPGVQHVFFDRPKNAPEEERWPTTWGSSSGRWD